MISIIFDQIDSDSSDDINRSNLNHKKEIKGEMFGLTCSLLSVCPALKVKEVKTLRCGELTDVTSPQFV